MPEHHSRHRWAPNLAMPLDLTPPPGLAVAHLVTPPPLLYRSRPSLRLATSFLVEPCDVATAAPHVALQCLVDTHDAASPSLAATPHDATSLGLATVSCDAVSLARGREGREVLARESWEVAMKSMVAVGDKGHRREKGERGRRLE